MREAARLRAVATVKMWIKTARVPTGDHMQNLLTEGVIFYEAAVTVGYEIPGEKGRRYAQVTIDIQTGTVLGCVERVRDAC